MYIKFQIGTIIVFLLRVRDFIILLSELSEPYKKESIIKCI